MSIKESDEGWRFWDTQNHFSFACPASERVSELFCHGGTATLLQCMHPYCAISQSQPCLVTSSQSTEKMIKIILPLNENICVCPKLNQGKSNPPSSYPEKARGFLAATVTAATSDTREHLPSCNDAIQLQP